MKVYRSVYNSESEVSKYMKRQMHYRNSSGFFLDDDYYLQGVNTFFEKGYGCKFFFLYVEDAFRYKYSERNRYSFYIIEYDIPEELLIPNVGLGLYSKMLSNEINFITVEFAVPISKLSEYDQKKRTPFVTGKKLEIAYLGDYNESNYPFIDDNMRRDSYYEKKEQFIDGFGGYSDIIFDSERPLFVKGLEDERDYEWESELLLEMDSQVKGKVLAR